MSYHVGSYFTCIVSDVDSDLSGLDKWAIYVLP